ncbi:hypothetical protein [Streptomyces sp. TRM68367]|uniref:hypothetical protein n=1 Tax=Streptomyces sp. TRM68367 TaxID=2758415 RepID=UPI00165BD16B|nr:hypothetical protein [Streptomyces sp. TRM68367]MBC9729993.1 hypothetical protein [Streptomyces sp. TRM68367]
MTRPAPADTIAPTRRPEDNHCWCCGTPGAPAPQGTLRADIHLTGHLCPRCWGLQPRGRNQWVRAASALYIALGLGREWHNSGFRTTWLEETARHHGVTAWHDAPRDTPLPSGPFSWLPGGVLDAAAADLAKRDDEFNRSRVQPAGPTGKAGTR